MEWLFKCVVTLIFLLQGAEKSVNGFYIPGLESYVSQCNSQGACVTQHALTTILKTSMEENDRQIDRMREEMNTRNDQLKDELKDVYQRLGLTTHKCGVRNSAVDRIVGGHDADINEYPWQVAVLDVSSDNGDKLMFGGTIISNQWILTAAHYAYGRNTNVLKVVIGEHDWSVTTETPWNELRQVAEIILHPDYKPFILYNDLALLKLVHPIEFPYNNKIAPVCLPSTDNLYEHVDAIVTGWGSLKEGGTKSHILQEGTVPTMSNEECQTKYTSTPVFTDNIICSGFDARGKGACQGDIGGPVITSRDDQSMELIGVVNWMSGCGKLKRPGVYARVSNYLPWINSHIRNDCSSP